MKQKFFLLLAGTLWAESSLAMCGCMVVPTPSDTEVLDPGIYNSASEVVVLRQGDRTTLTLSNDFLGDFSEFAIVMPVPEGIEAEDVAVVEPAPIQTLREVTAPRLNHWKCSDFRVGCGGVGFVNMGMSMDSAESVGRGPAAAESESVDVEAAFSVGEFDIQVLSSESSSGLLDWLDSEGFGVPASAEELLQTYIDAGSRFMVADVNLDAVPAGQEWLSPLQITYTADNIIVPIRLGTINSTGEQHVFFNVFTTAEQGRVGIANYTELPFEAGCMLKEGETLESAYQSQVDAGLAEHGAVWFPEFTGYWFQDLTWAGFVNDDEDFVDYFYTRLHLAVKPEAVTEDVVIYPMQHTEPAYMMDAWGSSAIEYVGYNRRMWDRYRFCGEDKILQDLAVPTCGDVGLVSGGCSSVDAFGGLGVAGMVLFLFAGRRRQS